MAIVSLTKINCDKKIMPREKINTDYVNDLFEDLESGAAFPPIDLFINGDCYLLADGYHRLEAVKIAGHKDIEAVIHNGDDRATLLFSSAANTNHGLRRTNKDKRKVVKNLLMDHEWAKWSDGKIAQHCAVTQQFVSKLRRELTQNGCECESTSKRLGADGRNIDTKNIGKKHSVDNPNHNRDEGTNNDSALTTSTLSVADLIPNPKKQTAPNKSNKPHDNKNKKSPNSSNKNDKSLWTKHQITRLVKHISNITTALNKIQKLLESQTAPSKTKVLKFKNLKDETTRLWIELYEEFDNLAE